MELDQIWKQCSTCKAPIGFGQAYKRCTVSTCNRKDSDFVFCTTRCWDSHLPLMRHRNAWATEERAPARQEWERHQASHAEAARRREERQRNGARGMAAPAPDFAANFELLEEEIPVEILVVVSKLKKYVRARSGLKTSETVLTVVSSQIRKLCDAAILKAVEAGRKTVMGRDFEEEP